jgi:tetratricopeptide (TPR) repeat protein
MKIIWLIATIIVICLGSLSYLEKIFHLNIHMKKKYSSWILMIFLFFSIILIFINNFNNKQLNKDLNSKNEDIKTLKNLVTDLKKETTNLKENNVKDLETIIKYSEIARMDCEGYLYMGKMIIKGYPINNIMKKLVRFKKINGEVKTFIVSKDKEAIKKYKQAIELYPNYPFSYFALALTLKEQGKKSWKEYAIKAKNIFEITTTIDDVNFHHKEALRILKKLKIS